MNGGVLFKWRLFSPATFISTHSLARWNWPVCVCLLWAGTENVLMNHLSVIRNWNSCSVIYTLVYHGYLFYKTPASRLFNTGISRFFFLLSPWHIWAWAFRFFHFYWMLPCQYYLSDDLFGAALLVMNHCCRGTWFYCKFISRVFF